MYNIQLSKDFIKIILNTILNFLYENNRSSYIHEGREIKLFLRPNFMNTNMHDTRTPYLNKIIFFEQNMNFYYFIPH